MAQQQYELTLVSQAWRPEKGLPAAEHWAGMSAANSKKVAASAATVNFAVDVLRTGVRMKYNLVGPIDETGTVIRYTRCRRKARDILCKPVASLVLNTQIDEKADGSAE
eukprot:13001299-Alexandrium_andersonii.AAC.1